MDDSPQPDPRITPEDMDGFHEHRGVFDEAMDIHVDRTPHRGELWLDDGRDKMIECAKDKVVRLEHAIKNDRPFNEGDALDAINYLAFAIRCNRRGRIEREVWDEDE
jgi:hypothetical protein